MLGVTLCSFEGPGGRGLSRVSGGFGEGETPLPIPNRAVKPLSADGTWPARARESRTPPVSLARAASRAPVRAEQRLLLGFALPRIDPRRCGGSSLVRLDVAAGAERPWWVSAPEPAHQRGELGVTSGLLAQLEARATGETHAAGAGGGWPARRCTAPRTPPDGPTKRTPED